MAENPPQHTDLVRDYFDERLAAYDAFYEPASILQRWTNRAFRKAVYLRRDQVLVLARRVDAQTILDVGSGSGRNAIWWARHGVPRIHGVELSTKMTAEARALAAEAGVGDRCTFESADFLEWQSGEKFDIVAACGVFDYVLEAEQLLAHMARFSNKIVYGSFPGWSLIRSPVRKLRYALRGCPTHFYRRNEIAHALDAVGFGPHEIKATPGGYLAWAGKQR